MLSRVVFNRKEYYMCDKCGRIWASDRNCICKAEDKIDVSPVAWQSKARKYLSVIVQNKDKLTKDQILSIIQKIY